MVQWDVPSESRSTEAIQPQGSGADIAMDARAQGGRLMIGNVLEDDPGELYRQRGRWFLLLGGLLGGIIAIATAFGFWLEQWGNHIGGGRGEDTHGIAVALAIALLVVVIVIALMMWRASYYLTKANQVVRVTRKPAAHPSDAVGAAVAAWTSSALGTGSQRADDSPGTAEGIRRPTPVSSAPVQPMGNDAQRKGNAILATELTIGSDASPRSLSEIIQCIESSEMEFEALWSAPSPQGNQVHVVLQRTVDSDARLAAAGLLVLSSQGVVLVDFDDRAGAAADIIRLLSESGVRVNSAQLATTTRMVITSDDPAGVVAALT